MHVNEIRAAGRLVQGVDILGDRQDFAGMLFFEPGKGLMGGVGLGGDDLAAAVVVELLDHIWIAGKAFGRRHVHQIVFGPDATLVPEGVETGFGGEAGAGQDHYMIVMVEHARISGDLEPGDSAQLAAPGQGLRSLENPRQTRAIIGFQRR